MSGTKKLFGVFLDVIFDEEDTVLVEGGLDLSLVVILPDAKKSKGFWIKVLMPSIHHRLLVCRRDPSLFARDEPGAHPDRSLGAPKQIGRQTSAVIRPTGTNDQDGSTGERRFLSLDCVYDGRDQDRGGHVPGVSASFTGLSADKIDACLEGLSDVLGVSNHLVRSLVIENGDSGNLAVSMCIHDGDSRGVKFLDKPLWRNTNSRH